MLAGGGTERVLEIAKRAFGLEGAERQRVLYQLVQLPGLRCARQAAAAREVNRYRAEPELAARFREEPLGFGII